MTSDHGSTGCALDELMLGRGDALFLVDPREPLTFAQTYRLVADLAARLARAGLGPGSLVGVYGLSPRTTILWFLAALVNRYLFVPLNDRESLDGSLSLLSQVLALDALVLPSGAAIAATAPAHALAIYCTSDEAPVDGWALWRFPGKKEPLVCENQQEPGWFLRYDQPASILLTSGSTGRRKGVLHTFGNHFFSASGTVQFYGLAPGDSWLLSLPLFHVGGLLVPMRCLVAGAACLLFDQRSATLGTILAKGRPTHLSLVPTQLFRLLAEHRSGATFAGLGIKALLLGGASTPRDLLQRGLEAALPISLTYGSTEACSQITATKVHEASDDPKCVGQLLAWRKLCVIDRLAHLAGETLFHGYVEKGCLSRPHDAKGWWRSADLVEPAGSAKGGWRYLGRADDIMIVGGENISPLEIERLAEGFCPPGSLCRVVPLPDTTYGVVPILFIFAAEAPDPLQLLNHLKGRLSGLKIPRRIYWQRSLPDEMHKISSADCLSWVHDCEAKAENGVVSCIWGGP